MRRALASSLCSLALVACGSESGPSAISSGDLGSMARAAFGAPAAVIQIGVSYLTVAAEAVLYASRVGGGGMTLVTTGTLTQSAPGTMLFQYSPGPDDRLRGVLSDGTTIEYHVKTMQGNFMADGATFLASDHDFEVRVVAPGEFDLAFHTRRMRENPLSFQTAHEVTVQGTFRHDGREFRADLRAGGGQRHDSDSTGLEHANAVRYTGKISTAGFDLDVDETWQFDFVSVPQRFLQRGGSASTTNRRISSSWTASGSQYRFDSARVATEFRDGKPNFANQYWRCEGRLLENGIPFGQLELRGGVFQGSTQPQPVAGNVEAILNTSGETIVLQEWLVH